MSINSWGILLDELNHTSSTGVMGPPAFRIKHNMFRLGPSASPETFIFFIACLLSGVFEAATGTAFAEPQLVHVREDFSSDPHWEGFQNRMVCRNCPTVIQNFGWSRTTHTSEARGEIGGRIDNSRVQAYYAMPLGRPLTFDDKLSASGKLALRHIGLRGVGYIGFFNPHRHTWRVWSSMAFRIWEEDGLGQIMFDWMSSDWKARGAETAILLTDDGAVHSWSFVYDPDAHVNPVWHDKELEQLITEQTGNGAPYELQGEPFLLERVRVVDPSVTAASLRQRLLKLRDQGLIEYFHRHGQHRWWKRPHPERGHGKITFQLDDGVPYVFWLDDEIRNAPAQFTRFGVFNIKRFGEWIELYLSDLSINGHRIDLSQDPHWEGKNNRARWTEPNFHAMNDYGFTQTNWAGKAAGEIGGLFWRTEPEDPHFSYYGDDVGKLTLDDPISFSGQIRFVTGMTDAAGYFGYFRSKDQTRILTRGASNAKRNMMGITIADSSAVGYYFVGSVSDGDGETRSYREKVFTPSEQSRHFTFAYNPAENNGIGRITYSLDGEQFMVDLTPQQRQTGATFDRIGLANVRSGGHSVEFYLDDLTYTVRRDPSKPRKRFQQQVLEVDYPYEQAGRKY